MTSPVGVKARVATLISLGLLFLFFIFFITSLIFFSFGPAFAQCERAFISVIIYPGICLNLVPTTHFISFTDLPTQWLYTGHFHFHFVAISVKSATI